MRFAFAFVLCLTQFLPLAAAAQTITGHSILLVASPHLDDPNFKQTVVLVTRHGRSPPIGVIINRPLGISLDKVFPTLPQAGKHLLHLGGPLETEQLVFIFRGTKSEGSIELSDGIFIGRSPPLLAELLSGSRPHEGLRVFAGFAGWAPEQLEDEIRHGNWHVLPTDAKTLFDQPAKEMWPALHRRATETLAAPLRSFPVPVDLAVAPN